jgi:phospholipase/carboxylesterase
MTFIIPQASDLTWYPNRFIDKRDANEPGISSGLTLINSIFQGILHSGISSEHIHLLGFSQGACLALDYAARFPSRFGGVFALSGGLIGQKIDINDYQGDLKKTPVFLGCSDEDFHIPVERIHKSALIFENLNAAVTKRIYPNMGHTINQDELHFVKQILSDKSVKQHI